MSTTNQKVVIPFDRLDVQQFRIATEEASLVDCTCHNPIASGDEEENDHG